jgi:hypothetical protein
VRTSEPVAPKKVAPTSHLEDTIFDQEPRGRSSHVQGDINPFPIPPEPKATAMDDSAVPETKVGTNSDDSSGAQQTNTIPEQNITVAPKAKTNIKPMISYTDTTIDHPSSHERTYDAPEKATAVVPEAAPLMTPANMEASVPVVVSKDLAKEMQNGISDGFERRAYLQPGALQVLPVSEGSAEPAGGAPGLIQAPPLLDKQDANAQHR